MAKINYMLEITMEARGSKGHKYIKRSFPIQYGKLDLSKYGYPYSKYPVEISNHKAVFDGANHVIEAILVIFGSETVIAPLHSFVTVKKEYTDVVVDPYLMVPKTIGHGEIYATFYLYIE